jgi:hypothetical protein
LATEQPIDALVGSIFQITLKFSPRSGEASTSVKMDDTAQIPRN